MANSLSASASILPQPRQTLKTPIVNLGPYSLNEIYIGDAFELGRSIPSESLDMIFCDPLYDRPDDYEHLAELAARTLKPNTACLVYCSDIKQFEIKEVMSKHLRFIKPLYYTVKAKPSCLRGYNIFIWTTPCLWFAKGNGFPHKRTIDTIISTAGRPDGKHKWNKNIEAYSRWIQDFTLPGAVIFDPFTGSGTAPAAASMFGRNYLAFERDAHEAQSARDRLSSFQYGIVEATP